MVGPKNPDANVCWCLSHRLDARTNRELLGPARGEYVRELCHRPRRAGLFERAGFTKAADTDSVSGGPRVLMRRNLT